MKATIAGRSVELGGWTREGNLRLADGTEYIVEFCDRDRRRPNASLLQVVLLERKWMLTAESYVLRTAATEISAHPPEELAALEKLANANAPYADWLVDGVLLSEIMAKPVRDLAPEQCWFVEIWMHFRQAATDRQDLSHISAAAKFYGCPAVFLSRFEKIPTPPPDYFHSFKAAAEYMGCTDRTVRDWAKAKGLRARDRSGAIRIARKDLDTFKRG